MSDRHISRSTIADRSFQETEDKISDNGSKKTAISIASPVFSQTPDTT
jgi:hypothetical protein